MIDNIIEILQNNISLVVSIVAIFISVFFSWMTINKSIKYETKKIQLEILKDFRKNFVKSTSNLPHSEASVDWKDNLCDVKIWFSDKTYLWVSKLVHYLYLHSKWRIAEKERIRFDSDAKNFDILGDCIEKAMSNEIKNKRDFFATIKRRVNKTLKSFKYLEDLGK
ncbi:MAG: hypothetical protein J6M39_08510 [Lachnospiraceae bacterium]|nr:hypothetical protein [Lachnospiraceae bacterium]